MFFSATSANIINHSASGKMPAPQSLCWWNRHLACCPSEAGKMPAPQAISLLVEQASCLLPIRGRQDACPTSNLSAGGTGILPVH